MSVLIQRAAQQVNGRERKTATFLSRCLLTLCLSVAVSRHVNSVVRLLVFAVIKS